MLPEDFDGFDELDLWSDYIEESEAGELLDYVDGDHTGGRGPGNFLTDLFPTAIQSVEMAFGADPEGNPELWSWIDVTRYFQWEPGISATIGYGEGSVVLTPASFTGLIRNDQANGGDFTLGNPYSIFWPNVVENTPTRARLDLGWGPSLLFQGYATSYKPTRNVNGASNFVTFQAHGVSRRIGKKDAAESPMYRWHMRSYRFPTTTNAGWPDADQGYHALPTHFYPLEESSGAVQGANVIDPSRPLLADGATRVPQFGGDTYLPGVKSLTRFNDGTSLSSTYANLQPGGRIESDDVSSALGLRVQLLMRLDESTQTTLSSRLGTLVDATTCRVLTLRPTIVGTDVETIVVYLDHDATDGLLLYCDTLNSSGVSVIGTPMGGTVGVQWERGAYITVDVVQLLGGNVEVRFGMVPITTSPTDARPTTDIIVINDVQALPGSNIFRGLGGVALAEFANAAGMCLGMLSIYNSVSGSFPERYPHALIGRTGDTVAERLYRLGVEQNVRIDIIGDATGIVMGPQSISPFLQLLEECGKVDLGLLLDGLGSGFTYIALNAMYSNDPSLILAVGDELGPDDPKHDDANRVNIYTATSGSGSSQRYERTDGELGTDRIGQAADSGEHRAAFDTDLVQIAAFKVGEGTVGGLRWPRFRVQFAKASTATQAQRWLETLPGAHVKITNLQPGMPEPDKSQLLRGWSNRVNSKIFEATLNLVDYSPYVVTVLAADTGTTSDFLGWLDTDQQTTTGTILPSESTYDGFEAGAGAWISQSGWTFALDATHVRGGGQAMKLTPPGATASGGIGLTGVPCTGGVSYTIEVWFYSEAGWADCRACYDWHDAAGVFISSSLGSATVVPAGVWTVSRQTLTAPANATSRRLRARQGGTPAVTDVLWVDDVASHQLLQVVTPSTVPILINDAVSTYTDDIVGLYVEIAGLKVPILGIAGTSSPQTLVIDPNGLGKALPTGSTISAWNPAVAGL